MKKTAITLILLLASLVLATSGYCVTPDVPETWDSGTAGWVRYDPSSRSVLPSPVNTSGWLQIVFEAQTIPVPEVNIIRAETNSSGGKFTGDYMGVGVTNVSFRFYNDGHIPAQLWLYVYNGTSGNWWYYIVNVTNSSGWSECNIALDCWSGWGMGNGVGAAQFRTDLSGVSWIGLMMQRNADTQRQVYGLDNFVLNKVEFGVDSDGDGMSDWDEFLAGTNPHDPNDRLQVEMDPARAAAVLKWRSVSNRLYGVWRSTNLLDNVRWQTKIVTGLKAMPPISTFVDTNATGNGPYYYKIEMEE